MSNPIGDRNLLAGLLAYEKKFISGEALVAAMNAWTQSKEKGLAQILREQKALTENQHALLEEAVYDQLARHGHDAKGSLAALSADDPIKQDLAKIADADLQASVAHVATAEPDVPVVEEIVEIDKAPKKKPAAVKTVKAAPKNRAAPAASTGKSGGGIAVLALLAIVGIVGGILVSIALLAVGLAFILMRDEKPIAHVKPDEALILRGEAEMRGNDKPPIKAPDKGPKQANPPIEPDPFVEVTPPPGAEGFVPLFNGKDLTGWKPHKTRAGDWRVADSILVGSPVNNAAYFLQTEQPQPRDFHLRVEARIGAPGNGSVYFRFQPDGPIVGYEAMIRAANNQLGRVDVGGMGFNNPGKGRAFPGGLRTQVPTGQWFTLEIIAKGDRLITKADGQTTTDVVDPSILTAGHIALGQIAQSRIEFRKIEIKELNNVVVAPPPPPPPVAKGVQPFPVEAGFVPLFNGKDLANWKQSTMKPRNWQVVDGILTGEGGGLNMLYTPRADYGDFHLRAEIRMNEDTSSSLAFRYPYGPAELEKSKLAGYVLRMTGKPIGSNRTGGLMIWEKLGTRNLPAPPNAIKAGEWFNLEIIAQDENVITKLNGVESLNYVYPKAHILGGRIVLEAVAAVRNPRIEYRKIEIKEFKAVPAPPPPLPEQPLGDFVKLFNGKDLADWRMDGNGSWKVIDGEIVGGPGALVSRRSDFRNCIVRVEVLPSADIEAFFSFREQPDPEGKLPIKGLSSRLTGNGKVIRAGHTGIDGSIGESGALPNDFKANQWMTIEFQVRPESISARTNGKGFGGVGYHPERFPAGAVGLHVIKGSVRIRRFEISSELAPGAPPPPIVVAGEFIPLFNGKDLTGWKLPTGFADAWRVEKGVLIGAAPPQRLIRLHTEAKFKDFHLRAEMRSGDKNVAHVGFRSSDGIIRGYNTGVVSMGPGGGRTGVLNCNTEMKNFGVSRPGTDVIIPPGQWFNLEVIAQGNRFMIFVDGKKTVDALDDTVPDAGFIYLGLSGKETLEFRKLEIKAPNFVAAAPPAKRAEVFVPLFNGKDLTGWKTHPKHPGEWRVENGILIGKAPEKWQTILHTERADFKDFHLRVEARGNLKCMGTLGIRSADGGNHGYTASFSGIFPPTVIRVGGVAAYTDDNKGFTLPRLADIDLPPGQWFTLEVIAEGKRLTVLVDGKKVTDVNNATMLAAGHINLGIMGPNTIEVRKVEIAEYKAPAEPPPVVAAGKIAPLFNGKDLAGWQPHAKRPGNWRVENGILIGSAPNGGSLYSTRGDYQDFHLRAEVRINDKGFGRIFGRAAYDPTKIPFKVHGYEVLINQRPLGDKTGTLTATSPTYTSLTPAKETPAVNVAGDWLLVEVIAKGDLVTVKVNAKSVAEFRDERRQIARTGHIALHQDANATIEFRKVEIEDLSAP